MTDLDQHSDNSSIKSQEGSDGGDIWGDEDEISYDRAIAEKDWSRMNETFGNSGYREGIEEGKEGTLQEGFNQGWSEGVHYGYELGRLRGLISPLIEYLKSTSTWPPNNNNNGSDNQLNKIQDKEAWINKANKLVRELIDLDIDNVFDKAFFDDKSHTSKTLSTDSTKSGCCGGSSSLNNDSCCKNETVTSSTEFSDISQSNHQASSSSEGGCCSSKAGGCNSSSASVCYSKEKDVENDSILKPEQVISSYLSKAEELLKEIGLQNLLNPA
ncbi:hypothetical protein BGZ46_002104 [Entomortierella lignicola]|nr:hypothetical protein BGZ46_002104 [Entomortierella lignicola]